MRKTIIAFCAGLILCLSVNSAKADSITLSDGTELKGKITLILDSIVDIKSDGGTKRITRDFSNAQAVDIVEIGLIRRKKVIGQVLHIDENTLHMQTPTGGFKIHRMFVRNISLKQEYISRYFN